MKTLLLLFCYLLFISKSPVLAQGCTIEGITSTIVIIPLNDTQVNTNLLTGEYEDEVLEVGTCTSEDSFGTSYFSVTANGTHFFIDTIDEFANFDKNTPKTTSSVQTVTLLCPLTCTSTGTLTIQFQVTDTNNHKPEFSKTSYELKVPSPVMPLTDISVYGDLVVATDIDFSNQDVTFTIVPDDFSITTLSTSTSKDYTAVFSTRSTLQLTGPQEYTITAVDSGNPTQSETVTLTITVDEEQSLDTPSFEQALYSFNYSVTNEVASLIPNDGSITLTTIKPNSVSEPTLSGIFSAYIGYFAAEFDASTRTIDFKVTDPIPTTSASILLFTLSVTTDNTASTSLIVYLSDDSTGAPQFSNHYYTGTYNDVTNQVEHDVITITSGGTPEVTISGDYADNFNITYDSTAKSCKISVKTSLPTTALKDSSYITLTLEATVDDYSDTAAIIIALPEHILKFTETLYTASYSTDHVVTIDDPLGFTTNVTGVSIAVDDTYSKNFEVTLDSDSNEYVISVSEHLSDEVLKKEKEIVLTLTATDTYENEAHAVLNIQLPQTETDAPTFSQIVYVLNYTDGSLEIGEDITISNREDKSLITVTLDSYQEYFSISYSDDKFVLNVIKDLPEDLLTSRKEIFITLTASEANNDATGKAVVIINWYVKDAPQFSEEYYLGSYPESGEGDIELDNDISFSNVDNPDNIKIQLNSYDEYFGVTYESDKWVLSVLKSLDDATLSENSQLIIILNAIENDNNKEGHSVLVLQLPTETIQFAEAYYVAEYPKNGTGTIEFENPIELVNADPTKVTIDLDTYADYFEILYDSDRWYINITKSLEDILLHSDPEIVITLTAVISGKVNTGKSALVLRLPTALNDDALIFSAAYYTAKYVENDTNVIEFENPVEITNIDDQTSVTITLDKNSDNFEVKYDDGRWYIHVLTGLDEDTKNNSTELLITLTATSPDYTKKGYSALVLKLPSQQDTLGIQFSNAFYLASYPEKGSGSVDFDKPIEFLNADDSSDINIELDNYTENFEVVGNGSKWYLNVKSALENSTLQTESELVVTLSATQNSKTATSALVIKLPTIAVETLEFSEAYYVADYPESGTGELELEKSIGFVNADDPPTVKIIFDSYTDNFDIQYETDRFTITIKTPLDDTILQENTEIVITLTASENNKGGRSVLVIKLPSSTDKLAPEFTDAYYLATYLENDGKTLELDKEISFSNIDDSNTIAISLDNYEEYFKINYTSGKWVLNIQKNLGEEILSSKKELVVTMTATETGNDNKGYSALVIELPTTDSESGPIFSEAYYLADYPDEYKGAIDFQSPIAFDNVDVSKVTIALDNFTDNFEIIFDGNKWIINVKQRLDSSVLTSTSELVMTLTATDTDTDKQGYSALVLRLPEEDQVAPLFSETYYTATYVFTSNDTQVVFTTPISVTNQEDISGLTIAIDNYNENFNIEYDDESGSWVVTVIEQLDNAILTQKTNLVVAITATNPKNSLTDHAAIDLSLPYLNTENAPKFSQTYYTAIYTISDGVALVTFDASVQITNKDNLNISIGLDNYNNNFEMAYDETSSSWKMTVKNNLDQTILNRKIDLVMALTATEEGNDEYGQAVVLIRLPVVNTDDAPKFSSIYYDGVYTGGDEPSVTLEDDIVITNKDNISAITIGVDDSYKDNFEVVYDTSSSQWTLNLLSPLSNDVFKDSADVILTLTATETGTNKIGQAALVLHLPLEEVKLAPEFSQPHYFAQYIKEDNTWKVVLNDNITVTNKADLDKIVVDLEDSTNFQVKSTSTNAWDIIVDNPLSDDTISSTRELIFTLTATEDDNVNEGKSTLIITLPLANQEEIAFSEVYYSASYSSNGELSMDDVIQIITEGDIEKVNISTSGTYSDHFQIEKEDDGSYKITVKTELPSEALTENNLILTLEAALGDAISYATLVINLPSTTEGNSIEFSEALYSASYEVVDGKGVFTINGTINVETEEDDTNVNPSISNNDGYDSYFEISYSSNVVTVTATDIPTEVLAKNSFIPLVLTVGIDGTSAESSAVLNVEINYEQSGTSIAFSNILYSGTYKVVDGNATLQITDTISIDTEEPDNINIIITNEYADFFDVELSENEVKITLNKQLTETIVNSSSVVPLALRAGIAGTSVIAEAVVNIAIIYESDEDDPESIEFGSVLYTAEYSVSDGKGSLTLDQSIKVISTSSDIEPTISADSVYGEYFDVSYTNNEVSVEVKENLPDEVVQSNAFITLTLEVRIKDTLHESSAVLNININTATRFVTFSNVLYSGKYEVVEGIGSLQITDTISIDTEELNDNINIIITNEYSNFFDAAISENEVKITLKKQLTETIVNSTSVVPLALRAGIAGTSVIAEAVVNIAIIYESDEDDSESIEFGSVLYTAEYSVSDGKGSLTLDQSIKVISTSSDIEPTISADSVYGEYFDVSYTNNEVLVELKENLPDEVVQSNTFIALTLEVRIKDTVHQSSAVLNININSASNNDQGSIAFSSLLYNAKYEIIDNSPNLTYGAITITTDPSDSNVEVKITNEYDSYFSVTYADKVVYIQIEKELTEEIVTGLSVVPLILQAQIEGTTYRASAVVNIAIIYDADGDTDFVQFTSVLYNGEYTIEDGKSSLTIDDSIKIVSSREDSDIVVYISEDSLYRDYFLATCAERIVTVTLTKSLPSAAVKSNFVALTLNAGILNTTHSSSAVLNIGINNEDDNSDSNDDDDEDSKTELHHLRITFIVVTAILSVLLLACIAGALAYYFLKIRSDNYANLEEDGSGRVRFGKNSLSRSPSSK